jgi:hypothetical protein
VITGARAGRSAGSSDLSAADGTLVFKKLWLGHAPGHHPVALFGTEAEPEIPEEQPRKGDERHGDDPERLGNAGRADRGDAEIDELRKGQAEGSAPACRKTVDCAADQQGCSGSDEDDPEEGKQERASPAADFGAACQAQAQHKQQRAAEAPRAGPSGSAKGPMRRRPEHPSSWSPGRRRRC